MLSSLISQEETEAWGRGACLQRSHTSECRERERAATTVPLPHTCALSLRTQHGSGRKHRIGGHAGPSHGAEAWWEASAPCSLLSSPTGETPVPKLLTLRQAAHYLTSHYLTSAQAELQGLQSTACPQRLLPLGPEVPSDKQKMPPEED